MPKGYPSSTVACSVLGCGTTGRFVRGMCMNHYDRWRKHGDPLAGSTVRGEPLRFMLEVVFEHHGDACLIWPFARSGAGYGQVSYEGKLEYVHRLSCQHKHGPAPADKPQALHECGRGKDGCVNPNHLNWGNQSENEADKVRHGTSNRREHRVARRAA